MRLPRNARIVPASLEHVDALAGNLRQQDQDELLAATGRDPDDVLYESFAFSQTTWAGLLDEKPVVIFGVGESVDNIGIPWMLGAPELERCPKGIVAASFPYLRKVERLFPRLRNLVDTRNKRAIRWLRWMGFTFDAEPVAHGPFGLPFIWFRKGDW